MITRRSLIKTLIAVGAALLLPAFAKGKETVSTLPYRCVGCKDCERVCPVDAIRFIRGKAVVDVQRCNGCMLCIAVCSYGAIIKCKKKKNT